MLLSVLTIAGVVGGWALVRSPEALFTPAWAIAVAAILLHAAGLTSLSVHLSKELRWRTLGTVAGVNAIASVFLASVVTSELYFVIGTV